NLRALIFQCEVDVARLRFAAIRDFALDRNIGEVFSEQVADLPSQLADREGFATGHEVEAELLCHVERRVFRVPLRQSRLMIRGNRQLDGGRYEEEKCAR